MLGGDTGLRGGIDIFAGPPQPIGGRVGVAAGGSSSAGVGQAGDRTKVPDAESERGTYTMFDEYGDPGERGGMTSCQVITKSAFVMVRCHDECF